MREESEGDVIGGLAGGDWGGSGSGTLAPLSPGSRSRRVLMQASTVSSHTTSISITQLYNMARRQRKEPSPEEHSEEDFENNDESEGENDMDEEDGPPSIDPYEVLGLETEATAEDVKKAYRKMALKCHPGSSSNYTSWSAMLNHDQTRLHLTRRKPPTRPFKRSHSHTPYSPTTADAGATTLLAAQPRQWRTTMISIG